jgi:hypothetical protein
MSVFFGAPKVYDDTTHVAVRKEDLASTVLLEIDHMKHMREKEDELKAAQEQLGRTSAQASELEGQRQALERDVARRRREATQGGVPSEQLVAKEHELQKLTKKLASLKRSNIEEFARNQRLALAMLEASAEALNLKRDFHSRELEITHQATEESTVDKKRYQEEIRGLKASLEEITARIRAYDERVAALEEENHELKSKSAKQDTVMRKQIQTIQTGIDNLAVQTALVETQRERVKNAATVEENVKRIVAYAESFFYPLAPRGDVRVDTLQIWIQTLSSIRATRDGYVMLPKTAADQLITFLNKTSKIIEDIVGKPQTSP